MLESLKQTIMIDCSIFINSLLYFLKRVPLLKRLFKKIGYEHSRASSFLYVVGFIYSMIKQAIGRILLLFLSFGIPYIFMKENFIEADRRNLYWHIFIIFYIILVLPNSKILEPGRRKFISVKLMRMNARRFVIADYFPALIWRQIIEFLMIYFVAQVYEVNIVLALFMVVAKNFFAIFVESFHIMYYNKTGNFLYSKTSLNILFFITVISVGYFTTLNQIILTIPYQIIFALGILLWIIGLVSLNYILSYNNFSVAINDANRLDKLVINMDETKKNVEFSKVKLKNKEFSKEELVYDKTNEKEGFAYINEIFFKRHKRILNRPIKMQSIVIFVILLVGLIASFFLPNFNQVYVKGIKKVFPIFIYALYAMSTGQKATKAMFYNCDISLLHYGFYKKKEAVLATFTIRAKHLIAANLMPAGLMAIGIILLDVLTGGSVTTLLPVGIMIIVLSIFFVVHNLFLYYIFQPYTTDLNVKNPLYKLFNMITYILCYISLQLENMSITFLVAVVLITFLYSIAALITVYRVAPKTFMIK